MADGNTTATAPTEGGGADTGGDKTDGKSGAKVERGSEFALPTGVKDAEIWDKHFGKGAKESSTKKPASGESSKKGGSASATPSASRASSSTREDKPGKDSSKSSAREGDTSTAKRSSKDSAETETDPSRSSSDKPKPSSEEADPADPEAPTKKARDLFAQAKKAEDPKEARRLYKRAMKEAFGEVPEEFDDGRYAAVRRERKAAQAAIEAQAKQKEDQIREAAQKVRPAIYVMRQLEAAKLADKLTVPLVEKTITVARALVDLENGDYTKLADVISKATGVDPDEAMKRFVRGVKVSPESRAAKAAAEAAERRAAEAERRMQELEQRLTERDTAQTEAQKRAERERQVAQVRADYLESIESELEDHPVLKLKDGSKRVMRYIIRTANKKLKAPRFTFTQAADHIVRAERERVKAARAVLDTDGEDVEERQPPARETRVVHIPRAARAETGVADMSPEASFSRIFDKHHGTGTGRRR